MGENAATRKLEQTCVDTWTFVQRMRELGYTLENSGKQPDASLWAELVASDEDPTILRIALTGVTPEEKMEAFSERAHLQQGESQHLTEEAPTVWHTIAAQNSPEKLKIAIEGLTIQQRTETFQLETNRVSVWKVIEMCKNSELNEIALAGLSTTQQAEIQETYGFTSNSSTKETSGGASLEAATSDDTLWAKKTGHRTDRGR